MVSFSLTWKCKTKMEVTMKKKHASLLHSEKPTLVQPVPGVVLIKLFWCKFTHTFLKAIAFRKAEKIMVTLTKWSSLQKSVSKFTPKKFYEIDPMLVSKGTLLALPTNIRLALKWLTIITTLAYYVSHGWNLPEPHCLSASIPSSLCGVSLCLSITRYWMTVSNTLAYSTLV